MSRRLAILAVAGAFVAGCTQATLDLGAGSPSPTATATPTPSPTATPNPPALVQQVAATRNSSPAGPTSITATFPSPAVVGNLLVLLGGITCKPITAVSGGGVASWSLATREDTHANEEIWYGIVSASSTSGATISTTCPSGSVGGFMNLSEWSGMAASAVLDTSASRVGSGGTTVSPPPISTSNASDLIILGSSVGLGGIVGTPTAGTWQALDAAPNALYEQRAWYLTLTSTVTAFQPTLLVSDTHAEMAIAAFKGATP